MAFIYIYRYTYIWALMGVLQHTHIRFSEFKYENTLGPSAAAALSHLVRIICIYIMYNSIFSRPVHYTWIDFYVQYII